MGMKFRFLQCLLLLVLLIFWMACGNNNSVATGGAGLLFVTAQANTTVSAFTVNLGTGALSANGNSVGTGAVPSAIAVTPSTNAVFVANSGSNDIYSYTINSDGSLTMGNKTKVNGTTPTSLAMDPAGKFLFAANQGSSNVSAFSISGTSLTAVPGSPFTTIPVAFRIRTVRCHRR